MKKNIAIMLAMIMAVACLTACAGAPAVAKDSVGANPEDTTMSKHSGILWQPRSATP